MRIVVIPFGFFSDDLSSPDLIDFSAPLIADRIELLNEEFEDITLIAGWENGRSTIRRDGGNEYITVRTIGRASILKYLWRAMKELRRYNSSEEDIVVINFNPHLPGSILAAFCQGLQIPFITYFIGLPEQSEGKFDKHLYTHQFLLRRSTGCICATPIVKDRLQDLANVPIQVVPNGVDRMFHVDEYIEQDELLVLYVGRFAPEKRIPLLLRAFAQVRNRGIGARLVLIGGRSRENQRELSVKADKLGISDSVTIKGRIPRDEVPKWMNRARTFVLPSRDEAFGMVLIEAMACGTPPIGMNSGSVPWVIDDAGPICGNEDELGTAISKMLTDEEAYRFYRRRSIERAETFSRVKWRRNLKEAIKEIVSS